MAQSVAVPRRHLQLYDVVTRAGTICYNHLAVEVYVLLVATLSVLPVMRVAKVYGRTRWFTAPFSEHTTTGVEVYGQAFGFKAPLPERRTNALAHQNGGNTRLFTISVLQAFQRIGTAAMLPPIHPCLLYTYPSPRDRRKSRMPCSA